MPRSSRVWSPLRYASPKSACSKRDLHEGSPTAGIPSQCKGCQTGWPHSGRKKLRVALSRYIARTRGLRVRRSCFCILLPPAQTRLANIHIVIFEFQRTRHAKRSSQKDDIRNGRGFLMHGFLSFRFTDRIASRANASVRCLSAAILLAIPLAMTGCGGGSVSANSMTPMPTPSPTPMATATPTASPIPSASPTPTVAANNCPAIAVQLAAGPQTGTAPFPAPAPEPPAPGTTANGSVCVSMPSDGATVTSPVHVYAQASLVNPIDHMRVYVDNSAEFFTFYNTVDAQMWLANGTHTLEVLATDKSGNDVSSMYQVNVVPPQAMGINSIQNKPNWEPCSALYPPGHPRAGQICAAGMGNAVSTMTEDQATPSLSGSSAKFTMGGPTAYSNELYTKYFSGGTNVSHFVYDLYFMIDNPSAAQALEFDVNQTFGNNRWVFGTECNFNGNKVNGMGEWDVWDGVKGWQPTTVPC